MQIKVDRIGRLHDAVKAKTLRSPSLADAKSVDLSYGELLLALKGHPAKGELDTQIAAYKRGDLPRETMEQAFDEFFGAPVVQDFSEKSEPFHITISVARVKEIGRLSTELPGM